MTKKIKILGICILACLLFIGAFKAYGTEHVNKIINKSLRMISPGIFLKENDGNGDKIVTGAYTLVDNKLADVTTEKVPVTINKGSGDEKTFSLLKFMMNGQIVSVYPSDRGSIDSFMVGKDKVLFTDNSSQGLWVADKATLAPKNIQPDTVVGISKAALYKKKEELASQGKDTDTFILYWVTNPTLSPNEKWIAFASNRFKYPDNLNSALYLTDLDGNTRLLVDETAKGNVVPVGWADNNTVVYNDDADWKTKTVNINTGAKETLINEIITEGAISPDGRYLIYLPTKDGIVQPQHYIFNIQDKKSTLIDVPQGYKLATGHFIWSEDNNQVVFYVADFYGNHKLIVYDCVSGATDVLDPPSGLKFDDNIEPSWSAGRMVFSAGGQMYMQNK